MDVHLHPVAYPCRNFLKEGKERTVTAFIVPIGIQRYKGKEIIAWACNWGLECEAPCRYAKGRGGAGEEEREV